MRKKKDFKFFSRIFRTWLFLHTTTSNNCKKATSYENRRATSHEEGILLRKICRFRILLPAVLILGGVFLAAAPAGAGEDKSYAVRGSYSLLEDFSFEGDYRFNPSFYLNLSFLDKRLRLQAEYLPVPALALKTNYDAD